jgi:hypothetical protein
MKASDILHVVPEEGAIHALYLKDDRVVRIDAAKGTVLSVADLPTERAIELAKENPPTSPSAVHGIRL